jgi:hypothetical protein
MKEKKIKKEEQFTKSNNQARLEICKNVGYIAYMVYLQILSHRNSKTGDCFPSFGLIASETGIGKRTVQNKVDKLEEYEYLKRNTGEYDKELKKNKSNNYFFTKYDVFDGDFEFKQQIKNAKKYKKPKSEDDKKVIEFKDIKKDAM